MAHKPRNPIDDTIERSGVKEPKVKSKQERTYKVIGDSKIPVTKASGKLWKARLDKAQQKRQSLGIERAWTEALKYYRNDQMGHRRDTDPDTAANDASAGRPNKRFNETENIVFANITSLVPALYSKNPSIEASTSNKDQEQMARAIEKLVNTIFVRKVAPGINLKPKMRKCVVSTVLMNLGWIEVGYTFKEQSSEAALKDLRDLSGKLDDAKTPKEIEEVEGELLAFERRSSMLSPGGPWCKFLRPTQVVRDPNGLEDDGLDCMWQMMFKFVSTDFLNAVYGEKDEKGVVKSIFEPTHILSAKGDSGDDFDIEHFTIFETKEDYSKHGFEDQETYDKAKYTMVWMVWDKITRRVLMYSDGDWTWPIWVWDDPYKLDRFFPFFALSFHTDPELVEGRGEVTYYLDQQDAINEINDEESRVRKGWKHNIIFDAEHISPEQVDQMLDYTNEKPLAVKDLPEGVRVEDIIKNLLPPSVNLPQMFNIEGKLRAIERIGSVGPVLNNAEFKTNTTNIAIESYEASTNTRLDEKLDAIEDIIGDIGWAIAQMCLQNMDSETVTMLLGTKMAEGWENMEPQQIQANFNIRTTGGSSIKPTSTAKKREAIQMGQVIGQFARATPVAVIVALKVMERAFDEIVITAEDWQQIREGIETQMQQQEQQAQQGQQPQQQRQPQQGAPQQGNGQDIEQILRGLSPQIQQAVQSVVAKGIPPEQALQQIQQLLMQQQPQEQQPS